MSIHHQKMVIEFGKFKGTTMEDLMFNHYHYVKWLINQPTSNNKHFENARTWLNALLEDDEFVSKLADKLPAVKPNHHHGTVVYKKVDPPTGYAAIEAAGTFHFPIKHQHTPEGQGFDFLLTSHIASSNSFQFEHHTDQILFENFMQKFEEDQDDTLLLLQRNEGQLTLLNYKFVDKIIEEKGEVDFLWQS